MLTATVTPAARTAQSYVFDVGVSGPQTAHFVFGLHASNWEIRVGEFWDTLLPLLALTRVGGPFYRQVPEATIRFTYPVDVRVCAFFVGRCKQAWGYNLSLEAPSFGIYDPPFRSLANDVLALGDGKDSRCLLGMLREAGKRPQCVMHGNLNGGRGIDHIIRSRPVSGCMSERLWAPLLQGGMRLWLGTGLDEVIYTPRPWRQFYDLAGPSPLRDLSKLLRDCGLPTSVEAPLVILPGNIVQRILIERYPLLAEGQRSCDRSRVCIKQAVTAVQAMVHGTDPIHYCEEPVFRSSVEMLVRRELATADWTEADANIEARACLPKVADHSWMSGVRKRLPPEWEGDWVLHMHDYLHPFGPDFVKRIAAEYVRPGIQGLHIPRGPLV